MPDIWVDVDTALASVPVNKLPLVDDTDFKTIEDAVVYNQAGLALFWNFTTTAGITTVTAVTPTTAGVYDWTDFTTSGKYGIEIPASGGASINNDTEGFGYFTGVATGILPWVGPVIGFRAAALNNALIDGGDLLDVNVTELGGASQSATDLKDFADAGYDPATNKVQGVVLVDTVTALTGHTAQTGDNYARLGAPAGASVSADIVALQTTSDSIESSVSNLANVGSATNKPAASYTLTTGTQSVGAYTATAALDGSNHEHTDSAGALELYYEFNIGSGVPASVTYHGYVNNLNDSVDVYGYDWVSAGWVQLGTIAGKNPSTNETDSFPMFVNMVGSGANDGVVRVRFYKASGLTSATLAVDQIYLSFNAGSDSYEGGAVWFNSGASNTGTEVGIDGTARNPVSTVTALLSLLGSTGLSRVECTPGSTLTLDASFEGYDVNGNGSVLALGSQDVGGTIFSRFSSVSGVGTTSANPVFFEDSLFATATIPPCVNQQCGFGGTLTQGGTGDYIFVDCYSTVAGSGSPTFTISAAGVASIEYRRFSGGITQSGIQSGDIMTIGGELGTVTLNGADGTVEIRGIYKGITDSRTGSPTLNLDGAIKGSDVADTLADTADIQPKIGTPSADVSADIAAVKADSAAVLVDTGTTIPAQISGLTDPLSILTTQMTESYASDGVEPTLAQCLFLIQQSIGDFAISGTTITTKQLDGSTSAATYTLDDASNPTSRTRTT